MKKFNLSALLALAMALCMAFAGTAMAESADAADTEFDPEALINSLTGSYTELFTTICGKVQGSRGRGKRRDGGRGTQVCLHRDDIWPGRG